MNWTLVCTIGGTALILVGVILWRLGLRAERRWRRRYEAEELPAKLAEVQREVSAKLEAAKREIQLESLHRAIELACNRLRERLQIEGGLRWAGEQCFVRFKGVGEPISFRREDIKVITGVGVPVITAVEYQRGAQQDLSALQSMFSMLVGGTPWRALKYISVKCTVATDPNAGAGVALRHHPEDEETKPNIDLRNA